MIVLFCLREPDGTGNLWILEVGDEGKEQQTNGNVNP